MKKVIVVVMFHVFILVVNTTVCFAECPVISIHYHERAPYQETTDTGVEGLTGTPVTLVFQKAGIHFEWVKTPSKRQLKIIKDNYGCDCSVGWFKNPDREKFARYTYYIYQDKPQIALARADNRRLKSGVSVASVLSNRELTLEVKDGYSYGSFLDAKIAQYKPAIDRTTSENVYMLKKIHEKRADYFFIAPEEADSLIESSGLVKEDFKYIIFSDMPEGEKRYIICSQKVKDEVIEKLNKTIAEHVFRNTQR
ncbi:MAG: transporter substrate-binding domain-containing protein [Desulfobacteraceae bacterium]|nr:transporter substrate-binding domain-containing protein [Desulfobacteraceae bacterium]